MQVTETEEQTPLMILIHWKKIAPALVMTPRHNKNTNSLKKVTCGTESLCFLLDVPMYYGQEQNIECSDIPD
jgi:hypothetical protein